MSGSDNDPLDQLRGQGDPITDLRELLQAAREGEIPSRKELETLHNRLDELETGGGGGIDDERLDQLLNRADSALDRVERSIGEGIQFFVGPNSISDDASLHTTPLFGILFSTDRELYLGDCTIKGLASGRVTATAYEIDGGDLGAVAARTPIEVVGDEREQEVRLDMHLSPGLYLLTRPIPTHPDDAPEWAAEDNLPDRAFAPDDDAVSLAKEEHQPYDEDSGWIDDNKHGTQWLGKSHPVWSGNEVPYWFYFYNLEVVASETEGGTLDR